MAAIPRDFEMLGESSVMGAPASEISPESGGTAPVKTLINVDFPAPFSPTKACTSPLRSSNEASRKACTPAKDFVTCSALSKVIFYQGPRPCTRDTLRFGATKTTNGHELVRLSPSNQGW